MWSLLNYLNNSYFPNKSKNLCMVNFCPEINEYDWKKIHSKSSPYRALSNLFWLKLDWRAIKSELGGINVFDTGAGKGGYALKLNDFAQGITAYFGVDLSQHEEWKNTMHENAFITLKQQTSNDILDSIPNETNFFMSQSAIEHFEHDLLYFEQIKNFIDKSKKNIIQIHLFPSAACLKLFPWHGVRQYTPRTISTIVQLFDSPNVYSMLFRIGGDNCNNLHYQFITQPLSKNKIDLRDSKTKKYRELLKAAVEKDIIKWNQNPGFYALVIHSNCHKPIFKPMKTLICRCI